MVDFGFLTFLHEADYWERSERGDLPVGLTLLMAANALRYVLHCALISVLGYARPLSPLLIPAIIWHGFRPLRRVKSETSVISPPSLQLHPASTSLET
jgi:hypothetical protein